MKMLSWPRGSGAAATARRDPARLKNRHRVLIADDDTPFARRLADYMGEHGFDVRVTATVADTKTSIEFWQPETLFIDLLLPASNAHAIFKFLQTARLKKVPKVIVMSKQALPAAVEQMRRAGASHYLIKPFEMEEAFRAITLVDDSNPVTAAQKPTVNDGSSTIRELHLLNLFLKQASVGTGGQASLHNLMRMINLKVKALRCSLIQCLDEERGRVLASNDDDKVADLSLDLRKYPEIQELRRTHEPLVIADVKGSDLLKDVQSPLGRTPYETIVLFPVYRCGTFFGVLTLRMRRRDPVEIFYVEKFGEVCAQILSLAIGAPGQSLVPQVVAETP